MGDDVCHHEMRIEVPDVAHVVNRRSLRKGIPSVVNMPCTLIVVPLDRFLKQHYSKESPDESASRCDLPADTPRLGR
jgi:hypothetical protein